MHLSAHTRIGNQKKPTTRAAICLEGTVFCGSNSFSTNNGVLVFSILTAQNVAFFESTTVCRVPIAFTTNCGGWYATI